MDFPHHLTHKRTLNQTGRYGYKNERNSIRESGLLSFVFHCEVFKNELKWRDWHILFNNLVERGRGGAGIDTRCLNHKEYGTTT